MTEIVHLIDLPDDCSTQWTAEFHDAQLTHAAIATTVRVKAGNVRRINTPAIQMLLAMARSLEARQGQFELDTASPAFLEAFADLGLAAEPAQWSTTRNG